MAETSLDGGDRAPVVMGGEPGSYARSVLTERHPALISRVRDAHPYTPAQRGRLDLLLEETASGTVQPLRPEAHDRGAWAAWGMDEHTGVPWTGLPFLWAESYFYRRLLGAVGYFAPGPWQGVDPFEPSKSAELHSSDADEEMQALDTVALLPSEERDRALLLSSVWGNRADLGFALSEREGPADPGADGGTGGAAGEGLVADESGRLWELLGDAERVCFVADNAARELLPDLALIDLLLASRRVGSVVLHIKPHPYFVSDATMADVLAALRRLREAGGEAAACGGRLREALRGGALTVRAHPFSCAPLPYSAMPEDLEADFTGSSLTVLKGDLNYRRLVGDRWWDPATPFAEAAGGFPSPVAALRTVKSDTVTGLDPVVAAELEAGGIGWRTSGRCAVVQVAG
ncbi:damage-control phosphatase ARMT1 family protein [Nocardiopsis suaedae]|uniref:Damage-control phosphatase ARMT1 family protein n=1 Tax=Nocardiopsis suaedae TaxID=3018444 RepID=A0ABT4TST9_9ACTN|nr:damage-control phosphatase ARMT1 family protein [Nocardiopsis suaedae]MDA2807305.1 damage-control phosphatase ARMT1 family protein [Nocardiopsis suaedae]